MAQKRAIRTVVRLRDAEFTKHSPTTSAQDFTSSFSSSFADFFLWRGVASGLISQIESTNQWNVNAATFLGGIAQEYVEN